MDRAFLFCFYLYFSFLREMSILRLIKVVGNLYGNSRHQIDRGNKDNKKKNLFGTTKLPNVQGRAKTTRRKKIGENKIAKNITEKSRKNEN